MSDNERDRSTVTRGAGLLETLLARLRADKANHLIPNALRNGTILDVGCGTTPYFLLQTNFSKKIGIDKVNPKDFLFKNEVSLIAQDFYLEPHLNIASGSISVVTMLAVFEHIERPALAILLNEVNRVLIPGGRFILTVPAGWTDPILRSLARLKLLSSVEVFDHKDQYSRLDVIEHLSTAGFRPDSIQSGYFEFGMNIWCSARSEV